MVVSKKNFLFRNPTDFASFILKKDVMTSDLPDWVAEHLDFKELCASGQIQVIEEAKEVIKDVAKVEEVVIEQLTEPKPKKTRKKKAKE